MRVWLHGRMVPWEIGPLLPLRTLLEPIMTQFWPIWIILDLLNLLDLIWLLFENNMLEHTQLCTNAVLVFINYGPLQGNIF
jgi:hypothetical protein